MSEVLDTAKFFWEVVKDGVKVNETRVVNVLPKDKTMMDLSGWEPVSFDETFQETTLLGGSAADFVLTTAWEFNGEYIGNFHLRAEGEVGLLSSIDVSVNTFEAHRDGDDVVELPYEINILFRNVTGGSKRKVIRAIATGAGGGRSLQ
jgi:hypothetical protein